ncbi:MAG: hypothetical protein M1480_17110 [Bacteroidetes bacterium]|nr:hypothetical protein [Bacteroidota bacterium]MCL5030733.1 hypothetical protein [Bacteroidota bacterium]
MSKDIIDKLDEYITSKLTIMYLFAVRFENIIEKNILFDKDLLKKFESAYNSVKNIPDDKIRFSEIDRLKTTEPEQYEKIILRMNSLITMKKIEFDITLAEKNFKLMGLTSIFIMSYSYFEECLCRTGEIICAAKELKINWKDLRGSTLEAIKLFFNKVVSIDYDFGGSQEWDSIQNYQSIRNYITHSGNIVLPIDSTQKIVDVINKFKDILISDKGEIIIKTEFITESINVYEKFFAGLLTSIKNTM